jgi:DNA-directed RNA polymerase subunit RPC12/RpoP
MVMPRKKDPLKNCKHCGEKMIRKRINGRLEDMGAFLRRVFCNRSCMALGYVNPARLKGAWYQEARKLRGKSCENCGGARLLAAHHVDGNWKNNSPENIQTLCVSCHAIHHHRVKRAGLTAPGRMEPRESQQEYLTGCRN